MAGHEPQPGTMHDGQLAVSVGMVRALVGGQFPAWRGLAVRAVEAPGTVNAIFRIGDRFAARFPLVAGARVRRFRPGR
jgi:aminoglycoside phosphotransferase (APT) family kinase protein